MFKTVTQHGSFNTTSKPKPRERFKPEIQLKGTIVHLILFQTFTWRQVLTWSSASRNHGALRLMLLQKPIPGEMFQHDR